MSDIPAGGYSIGPDGTRSFEQDDDGKTESNRHASYGPGPLSGMFDQHHEAICPICGEAVQIQEHPTPGWRLMLPHDHDGERCPGTGRGLAEAREFARMRNQG